MSASPTVYDVAQLIAFATALLERAGLGPGPAATVAEVLVEGDLLGHTTHGLQLAAPYLGDLAAGVMATGGAPTVVADRGGAVVWDGRRLPGPWLVVQAIELARARAAAHGIAAVAIRESCHIGCLAAYLERATRHGAMILLTCSDPSEASVAPFGGIGAVFTPDPIAVGIPTDGEPILIDMSASITTNGMTARLHRQGQRYPGLWAQDAGGQATDDPGALFSDPPGTLLPTGGIDHGHKGTGLALTIEALSQGLSGHGRADRPTGWGASVYVQVMAPDAFGGSADFLRQTTWMAAACRASPPAPGVDAVRLPGERGLAHKRRALAEGLALQPGIMAALAPIADRLQVEIPSPLRD